MDKIDWCKKQKRGIEFIEPNINLAQAYVKKAENALDALASLKGNREWEISSAYYTMYFSLYSLLMKIGIKCEIHACTITCMKRFLSDYFTSEEIDLIERAQKARIDVQYYSDRNISDDTYHMILDNTTRFFAKAKDVLYQVNETKIQTIRKQIHTNKT